MHREIHKWWSPRLNKDMEVAVYGHYGFALLMLPTAAADFLEYERFHLIDAISGAINSGKCKAFSINSINSESWLNDQMNPADKAVRHMQFNDYVFEEVVPFIHNHCQGLTPIVITGASLGALHSVNMFFKRPDIFKGVIGMSGSYNLKDYTNGYYDDNCYFNSPADYMPGLDDEDLLNQLRTDKTIIIASGQGNYEKPEASQHFSEILNSKNISHTLDLWGHDMAHDWPTWRQMLPYFLDSHV